MCLCGAEAVQFGREGRKHLLTERESEGNNMYVWSVCSCVRMCACARCFSIKAQCGALPPVSGRPGHGPLSSGAQTQTPSCSTHMCRRPPPTHKHTQLGRKQKLRNEPKSVKLWQMSDHMQVLCIDDIAHFKKIKDKVGAEMGMKEHT